MQDEYFDEALETTTPGATDYGAQNHELEPHSEDDKTEVGFPAMTLE
jgi:hypothetical protein